MFRLFLNQLSLIHFTEPEPFHQEDKRSDQCDKASYHAFSGFVESLVLLYWSSGKACYAHLLFGWERPVEAVDAESFPDARVATD